MDRWTQYARSRLGLNVICKVLRSCFYFFTIPITRFCLECMSTWHIGRCVPKDKKLNISDRPSKQPEPHRPRRRRRRLTIPSGTARQNPQLQALFIARLPLEIRQQIYHLVIGGQVFHIWRDYLRMNPKTVCRRHCATTSPLPPFSMKHGCPCNYRDEARLFNYPLSPLPLLQTCRRIYAEAIETLYAGNIFEILDHADIILDLRMAGMPLHRFNNNIRHLRIGRRLSLAEEICWYGRSGHDSPWTRWKQAWDAIARMEGLLTLEVELELSSPRRCAPEQVSAIWMNDVLGPLWKVTGLRRWDVRVNWQEAEDIPSLEEAPFRLTRLQQAFVAPF